MIAADFVCQDVSENLPHPGPQLGLAVSLEFRQIAARVKQGLLHEIGRVELSLQAFAGLQPREEGQPRPIALGEAIQSRRIAAAQLVDDRWLRWIVHGSPSNSGPEQLG